jgi:hypothetical protein
MNNSILNPFNIPQNVEVNDIKYHSYTIKSVNDINIKQLYSYQSNSKGCYTNLLKEEIINKNNSDDIELSDKMSKSVILKKKENYNDEWIQLIENIAKQVVSPPDLANEIKEKTLNNNKAGNKFYCYETIKKRKKKKMIKKIHLLNLKIFQYLEIVIKIKNILH